MAVVIWFLPRLRSSLIVLCEGREPEVCEPRWLQAAIQTCGDSPSRGRDHALQPLDPGTNAETRQGRGRGGVGRIHDRLPA